MKIAALTLALLASALALQASAQSVATLPTGVWRSEGYGYVVRVSRNRVQTYDLTTNYCVRGETYGPAEFSALYGQPQLIDAQHVVLVRRPTRDPLVRLDSLPSLCRHPLRGRNSADNYNVLTETFAELYPFFSERGVNWPTAVATMRAQLTDDNLFESLTQLVQPLNDGHVTLNTGERTHDPDFVTAPGAAPDGQAWSWRSLRTSLRDYLQGNESPLDEAAVFAANRRVLYGRAGEIGYIAILAEGGWAEGQTEDTPAAAHAATAASELENVLTQLNGVRGIIIDLRANSGGFDAVAMEILSRFAAERRLAYRKHARGQAPYDVFIEPSHGRRFDGPVAVLIGPNTVSAGETVALGFAALHSAHLFGQPTRGIMSDAIPKTLPNGWSYTLSVESTLTPDGELVEARGVQPDVLLEPPPSPELLWSNGFAHAHAWLRRQAGAR